MKMLAKYAAHALPLLAVLGLFPFQSTAKAALFSAVSGEKQTTLIELYSSEGCSSCPPADEWLTKLKTDPRLWQEFVPTSYHVDYWDYLGWTDRWAKPEFTSRQRQYSRTWGTSSIYTPGFVLDGREWRSWGGKVPANSARKSGILSVTESEPGKFKINFAIPEGLGKAALKAHVAVLGFDILSNVTAGENSGRKLLHDFVVLQHQSIPLSKEGAADFDLPRPAKNAAPKIGLAFWVSPQDGESPIQSTGGWWNP